MLNEILKADEKVFLFLNNIKFDILNHFFLFVSSKYFLIIPILIFAFLGSKDKNKLLVKIVMILLTIGFVDYTIYNIFKPLIQRIRPCHEINLAFQIKLIGNCGGKYGFFSSHAGNSSALVFMIFGLFKTDLNFKIILYFWLFLVCFSRVYLGVHYPLDVIFGALYGFLLSKTFFKFYNLQFTTQ